MMNENKKNTRRSEPEESWVRERLATRLYEPLPPEEELAVENYLRAHPEFQKIDTAYRAIVRGIGEGEVLDEAMSEGDVSALVRSAELQYGGDGRHVRTRVWRWLGGAAVAASLAALVVAQGVTLQIGGMRLALGNAAVETPAGDNLSHDEVRTVLAALLTQAENQNRQMEYFVEFVSQLREADREDIRKTFKQFARRISAMSGPQYALASYREPTEEGTDLKSIDE